jgi:glutamate dehydrogenase/leucine dehydrogenase
MVKQTAAIDPSVIAAAASAAGPANGGVRFPADRLLGDTLLLLICP